MSVLEAKNYLHEVKQMINLLNEQKDHLEYYINTNTNTQHHEGDKFVQGVMSVYGGFNPFKKTVVNPKKSPKSFRTKRKTPKNRTVKNKKKINVNSKIISHILYIKLWLKNLIKNSNFHVY